MDICGLSTKSGGLVLGARWRGIIDDEGAASGFGSKRVSAFRVRKAGSFGFRVLVMRATGKKNHGNPSSSGNNDPSIPEGDSAESVNPQDDSKSHDSTHKSPYLMSDWRDFRANLVAHGHELLDFAGSTKDVISYTAPSEKLGAKWAHPIPFPEPGCVLIATEKLDGARTFERSVVLLLRLGTRDVSEGPFGVIINRPLHKKIKHMNPSDPNLSTIFTNCLLHFGGPLDTSMFLIKTGSSSLIRGFEQVVPGICFGAKNSLEEAAKFVKKGVLRAEDFCFFVGYAGWQLDQLRDEIKSGYWVVAACSSFVIGGSESAESSQGLWSEILQLMGGQYSELSRKPKRENY